MTISVIHMLDDLEQIPSDKEAKRQLLVELEYRKSNGTLELDVYRLLRSHIAKITKEELDEPSNS